MLASTCTNVGYMRDTIGSGIHVTVLISGVVLYRSATVGTKESVHI